MRPTAFDFREVLEGACEDARILAEAQNISVEADLPGHLLIMADRFAIELIVQNLTDNALRVRWTLAVVQSAQSYLVAEWN